MQVHTIYGSIWEPKIDNICAFGPPIIGNTFGVLCRKDQQLLSVPYPRLKR